jgi:CheY-like chemotaxis protein
MSGGHDRAANLVIAPQVSAEFEKHLKDRTMTSAVSGGRRLKAVACRLTRMMLMNIGAKLVDEGADGLAALDIIRHAYLDVMLLDWEMPRLGGPQKTRPWNFRKFPSIDECST